MAEHNILKLSGEAKKRLCGDKDSFASSGKNANVKHVMCNAVENVLHG